MEKKYPLPYKSFKSSDDPSWRASEYVYEMGREAVVKALLNIADTRADELLLPSTGIPEAYLDVLNEYNIIMTADDYWNYLSGKYVSRAHNRMIDLQQRPDPLLLVKSKMKEKLNASKYVGALFKLYQKAVSNGADKDLSKHYQWQTDQKRLAEDLFEFTLPSFTAEVKRLLPAMEPNAVTRKYLAYLYKQREYAYLAEALKGNKNPMKAFLAEDVKETMTWNAANETKYLGIEECLLPKMPKVAERIKKEIEAYLKESSINYTFYRWWIEICL